MYMDIWSKYLYMLMLSGIYRNTTIAHIPACCSGPAAVHHLADVWPCFFSPFLPGIILTFLTWTEKKQKPENVTWWFVLRTREELVHNNPDLLFPLACFSNLYYTTI